MDRLQQLLEDGVIDEVYSQLKSGKEADVFLVSHRGEPVAAKLYKAREFRSFKNDAGYKEGRQVRNTRTQRAMDKGSRFGRVAAEEAWKSAEADAMFTLHAAGVRVPKPVLFYEGVLLMEVIGDAEGRVAPRLVDAGLGREQAEGLYRVMRGEVIKMLCADLIHGDLSEFNVLLGANGPVIIDFPQVIAAAKNSRSEQFLKRDVGNMLRFFSSLDPALSRYAGDGEEIWRAYVRRVLTPDFEPRQRSADARPFDRGGPRQGDRGGPRQGDRGGPRQGDRGGPRQGDRGGPRQENSRGPRHDDRGGSRRDDRGAPRQGDRDGSRKENSRGPRHDDRGGPRHDDRGGPRHDDRGGPRHDDRGGPRHDDRGGPRHDDRGGPRHDDRGAGQPRHAERGSHHRREERPGPGGPPRGDAEREGDRDRGRGQRRGPEVSYAPRGAPGPTGGGAPPSSGGPARPPSRHHRRRR